MANFSLSRRNFVKYSFLAFLSFYTKEIFSENIGLVSDKNLLKKIKEINGKRKFKLKKNLDQEIKSDLIQNRTIWIGKKLYTFAEIK